MPNTGTGPWTAAEDAWFPAHPDAPYSAWLTDHPETRRSFHGWRHRRRLVLGPGCSPALKEPFGTLRLRPDTPSGMPPVEWDKQEIDFHWRDVLEPVAALQEIAKAASGSQDRAHLVVETDRPTPILFISDWHIGSWGTSLRKVAEITALIQEHNLMVAVLGDMIQLSIKLRNVLEVSDNLLPPRLQVRFIESWLKDLAPHIVYATWDNHAVMREESSTGFSQYAELFKDKTIYHSGIGFIDLTVGQETYNLCSSHRFRGNSYMNPTHGQARFMRFEGIDREVAIAGDSHRPGIAVYTDGPMIRYAINIGSLQTDSGYAKRHFSLATHDCMPILVFHPTEHRIVPFMSLEDYLATTSTHLGS